MNRHGIVTRDSRVTSRVSHGDVTRCVTRPVTVPRPDPTRPTLGTAVSGVSGTTSIDLTVGVESPPEAWMLEDLDISPDCEYRVHPGCRAAEWIVWCKPICEHAHPARFFCDPCLELRRGPSRITCLICGTVADSLGSITRIERI